jgi:hypothetical protein
LKLLNQIFLIKLPRYLPITDSESYMRTLCRYSVPEALSKVVAEVSSRRMVIIDRGIMQMVQMLFRDSDAMGSWGYIAQVNFWQIVNAHNIRLFKTDDTLVKSILYVVSQNLQRLRYDKEVTKIYTPTFVGLTNFFRQLTLQTAALAQSKD